MFIRVISLLILSYEFKKTNRRKRKDVQTNNWYYMGKVPHLLEQMQPSLFGKLYKNVTPPLLEFFYYKKIKYMSKINLGIVFSFAHLKFQWNISENCLTPCPPLRMSFEKYRLISLKDFPKKLVS